MPRNASDFIEQVRNLAFFEFLTDWVFDLYKSDESQCETECSGDESRVGVDRLGSSNFLKNAGFMALAGIGLILTLLALAILIVVGK